MAQTMSVLAYLKQYAADLLVENCTLRAEVDELNKRLDGLAMELAIAENSSSKPLDNQHDDPLQSLYQEDSKDL